jgi:hypothetical protein
MDAAHRHAPRKNIFWLIDVVPSRGEDTEEAKDIVRSGPIIWLSKKLMNDIGNWTYEDTEAFVKCLNWRARIFFGEGEKFHNRVQILKDVYYETEKQPSDLPKAELDKLMKPYQTGWFGSLIVNPHGWSAILGLLIITAAILYLNAGKDVWILAPNLA